MPRSALWEWWQHPDADNQPEGYLDAPERTAFLVDLVERLVPKGASVLEIGCNVGRNLGGLAAAGYVPAGIELNNEACAILRRTQPDVWLCEAPIETVAQYLDSRYGLVFTMAVLEHLHPSSEWVFAEMARIAPMVITIEDEVGITPHHCPRNYSVEFDAVGMRMAEAIDCSHVEGLGPDFMARVFVR